MSSIATCVVAWISLVSSGLSTIPWTLRSEPRDQEADVSCYLLPNNTYRCAPDVWIARGADPDDSY